MHCPLDLEGSRGLGRGTECHKTGRSYIYTCLCIYVYMYECVYICICICVCTRVYTFVYVHTHIQIHTLEANFRFISLHISFTVTYGIRSLKFKLHKGAVILMSLNTWERHTGSIIPFNVCNAGVMMFTKKLKSELNFLLISHHINLESKQLLFVFFNIQVL